MRRVGVPAAVTHAAVVTALSPPPTRAVADPVLSIGHRGASGHASEHTVLAYDLALELGADYIEQELQVTSDGVLVVLHDATCVSGPPGRRPEAA